MSNEKVCGSMALKLNTVSLDQVGERCVTKRGINYPITVTILVTLVVALSSTLFLTAKALIGEKREVAILAQQVKLLEQDRDSKVATIAEKDELISDLEELNIRLQIWNKEVNKPLKNLEFNDFSLNPISNTPDIYREKFIEESKKYGIPASLTTAQASVESNFKKNATYFGGNGSNIINWKQVHDGNGNYAISVVYKNTKKWVSYNGECSLGIAQINLTTHDKITVQQAYNPDYSIKFMCDRWSTLLAMYPNKPPMYIAMAYNTPAAAKKGESLLNNTSLTGKDMERAKFIVDYGERVLSLAREERLKEIYEDLFTIYLSKEDISLFVPPYEVNLTL